MSARLFGALLALATFTTPVSAAGQALSHPVSLAGSPDALAHFHRALRQGRARVLVYGASHTAPDVYTGELRRRLTARFGDGGPGWVLPGYPFAFYEHDRVAIESRGWEGRVLRYGARRPTRLGLAGFALDAAAPAEASLHMPGSVDVVEVHYLRQRGGGTITVEIAGRTSTIDTSAGRPGAGHAFIRNDGDVRSLRIRSSGRVRLFGVTLERSGDGVTVDAFGVPGARFHDQAPWDEGTLRASLSARAPDLVAFAYGTNEGVSGRPSIGTYRRRLRDGLARWRRLAPAASCLLIGPGDVPRRRRDGVWVPRARLAAVIEVQRVQAREAGCAFFDTRAMMGGAGGMEHWVQAGLAIGDRVHFTEAGYRRMGAALYRALLEGFDR